MDNYQGPATFGGQVSLIVGLVITMQRAVLTLARVEASRSCDSRSRVPNGRVKLQLSILRRNMDDRATPPRRASSFLGKSVLVKMVRMVAWERWSREAQPYADRH
jgi:hypothetical protein